MSPLPPNEPERLRALHALRILDTAPEEHFDAVVRMARRVFGVPVALISLLDENRQWFKARCGLDMEGTSRESAFCNHTILSDEVLVVEDAAEDERFRANPLVAGPLRFRFYAGAPLVLAPNVRVGTLCLFDTRSRTFSEAERETLRDLAETVVAHLRLHAAEAAAREEVSLRRAGEEALKERDRLLSMAEKMAQVGHWRIALPSQQFTWSAQVHRIFGLREGETPPDVPTAIDTFCHEDDRNGLKQVYANLIASGGHAEHAIRLVRRDGAVRHVTFRAMCETNPAGEVTGLFGVIMDLTEFMLTEARARDSAALLEATLENMDQGLLMVDGHGIVQVANSRAEGLLGLPRDFLKSNPSFEEVRLRQLASGDYTDDSKAALPFLTKAGFDPTVPRYERERPNGTVLEVRTVTLPTGGAVRTFTDVTARKRAEAVLAESEARYRTLADALPQKVWVTDPDGVEIYRNRQREEYCGSIGVTIEDRMGLYHPDDVRQMWAVRHTGVASGTAFEAECRMRRRDGIYRWHHLSFTPIRTDGVVSGWVGTALDIHEMREAQDELRRHAELLQIAQEAAGAGAWDWDIAAGCVRLSPEAMRMHGLDASRSGVLTAKEWQELVDPRDLPEVRQRAARAIAERSSYSVEFRVQLPDGRVQWILGCGRVLFDADTPVRVIGLNLDITARKLAEEALKASEERFAFALDASEDGLWDWDIVTNGLWISNHCCALLGHERHEIEPHLASWQDRIHPEDRLKVKKALDDHLVGLAPSIEVEHRLRHKDGTWIWTLDRGKIVAYDEEGRPTRAVGTLIDITERKKTEDTLARAKATADAALAQAEKASAAKSEFLATMSHEVRTPLHGILGHTDLLLADGGLSGDQRRHAERIRGAGAALLTVVNDILDFSKIDAGQIELDPQVFAPATLVESAVSIVKGMANAKGLSLYVDVAQDLPAWVVGDHDRLRQVLLNLLNNAVKFTPAGSVALRAEAKNEDGDLCRLRFTVEDTGIGIPQDKRDRLFQRFSQVDGSVRREFGGTGLGLAISKRLVELMGGEIGLESREAQGSAFWFTVTLPLAQDIAHDTVAEPQRLNSNRSVRVLLAEDNEINQEIARAVLEAAGHEVDIVEDGAEAIMAIQANAYDLVLMDVQMPNVDGITATRRIRALEHPASAVPIVAMTANVLPQQVQQFRAAGMNDHVGKPFKREELYAAIDRWAAARMN